MSIANFLKSGIPNYGSVNPYAGLATYGTPTNEQLMGIDPSAKNPFMFSNGNDPITGTAVYNSFADSLKPAVPTIPQIGAEGVGIDPAAGVSSATNGGSILDSFLSKDGQQGWGNMAFGALGGIANLYMGLQQLGVAKDTLAQNKAMFEKNYAAQKTTTNAALEDRQRARVASNPGAYQSVGTYMAQNGIK